ncbi:tetratricopeptide repeat protein [bacterium]|nr:tetratricopeptide repeat protein [bacterium]
MDTSTDMRRSLSGRFLCLLWLSLFCLLLSPIHVQGADWVKKLFRPGTGGTPPADATETARRTTGLLPQAATQLPRTPAKRPQDPRLEPVSEVADPDLAEIQRLPGNGAIESSLPNRQPHRISIPDLNFRFEASPRWYRLSIDEQLPDQPRVALTIPQTGVSFVLYAERLAADESHGLAAFTDRCRQVEDAELEHVWRSECHPTVIAGVAAQSREVTGFLTVNGHSALIYRISTTFESQGVAYCLVAISPAETSHLARLALKELSLGFRLIDVPTQSDGQELTDLPVTPQSGRDWGLSVDADESNWQVVDYGLAVDLQGAKLAAIGADSEVILVAPFSLLNETPGRTALTASLAELVGFHLNDLRDTASSVTIGDRDWIHLEAGGITVNRNRRSVLLRLHQRDGMAYAVSASYPESVPPAEQTRRLDDFLNRVTIAEIAPPTSDQLSDHDRWQHAELFNRLGNYHARLNQFDLAARYFRVASQLAPGSSKVAQNLLATLARLGRYEEALNLLNQPPSEVAVSDFWQTERASMLAQTGHMDDAIQVFARLFADGSRNENAFEAYLGILARTDRVDAAITAADQFLTGGESRQIALIKSRLLVMAQRYDEAIAVAKSQQSAELADPSISYFLIEAYRDSARFDEALQEVEKLLRDGNDDARTWFLKATVEIEQKQYRAARTSLETVLERQPDHPEVRETLELVSSLMGQSDNTEIRRTIAAVPLPESIQPVTVRSGKNRDASAWYGLVATAHGFKPGHEYRRTTYGVVHLEDAAAVSEFSTLQFSYRPLAERVFVNRVEVFDHDGRLLARGHLDDYYVQSNSAQELASEERLVNVPVPGLKPGCRLEYVVTAERLGQPETFPFTQYVFSRSTPSELAVLHITGDIEHLAVDGPITPQKSSDGLTWLVRSPPTLTDEPLQVEKQRAYPVATIAGIDGNWQTLAERYLERFSDRLEVVPEVRELAQRIVSDAGATTLDDKVMAMNAFVQHELVYQGLEFGVRGQVMPPVLQTLQRRYGDCKDHSLLLYQLLRAVDVPASLCIVQTEGSVVRDIPSMDQFNHMIVYVDDGKDGWFLDATSKGAAPSFRIPPGLAKHDGLILDGAASRLVRIPDYPNGASQVFADRLVQLDADGQALVTEVVQIKGYSAALYRSLIRDIDLSKRNDFVRDYLTPGKADAKGLTGSVTNLSDHSQPLVLKATYQVRDLLHPAYGQLVGRLPAFLESSMVQHNDLDKRHTSFQLTYPTDVIARTRLRLPPGYSVEGAPENVATASAFGGLASRVTVSDGQFEILSRLTRHTGEYSAEQWRDYAAFLSLTSETFSPRLLLREGPVQQASRETAPAAAGR